MCDHDACGSAKFAFHANALSGYVRFACIQGCDDDFEELVLVNRAATQLEVNFDMLANGRRLIQRINVFGFGVYRGNELFDIFEIAKCLNPTSCCTCTDSDEQLGFLASRLDSFDVMSGCN